MRTRASGTTVGAVMLCLAVLVADVGTAAAVGGVGTGPDSFAVPPPPTPIASLLTTGGLLFLWGLALLAIRKTKKEGPARLTLAGPPDEPAASQTERHFGQEERR